MANITKSDKNRWMNGIYVYEGARDVLETKIKLVESEYNRIYVPQGYSEIQKTSSRIKKFESIVGKLEKLNIPFTIENVESNIHDVVGCRIVCLTLYDVAIILKLLGNSIYNTDGFKLLKCKDYISEPKPSGYRSVHIRVLVPVTFSTEHKDVVCEIQVRTANMDSWAQLEHKSGYKPSINREEFLATQLAAYSSMGEGIDKLVCSLMQPVENPIEYTEAIVEINKLIEESNKTHLQKRKR